MPVVWAVFTDWQSSFPVAVETCKAHGILKLSCQIARATNKYRAGSETVAVHGLVGSTAMFARSSVAQFFLISESPWCWS